MRALRRLAMGLAASLLLTFGLVGTAFAYAEVDIPPAACESVQFGIAHFHDSPAPANMQQTPAWGNTSRFVYENC